ncbi:conserved oligomeric Golgi complex subunit 8 [Petromyzon marinus]|uniref:conserved oligomeric Golgi complex subunit 8 n=1 Tax=Petromyzon marinus TaxID=7757 RepID=UPI003F72C1A5
MATAFEDEGEDELASLASLLGDSLPAGWRDSGDVGLYLHELSSHGVEWLRREPERLAEERGRVQQQTRELAYHDHGTFVQTAECSARVLRDFGDVEERLGALLDKLPAFGERCRRFARDAEGLGAQRRTNALTLGRHTELLELLEAPQLMDTCVRNAYYDEALELLEYVKRLEKRHASIPVVAAIVSEVRASAQLMLSQLLQQLRTALALPACLRAVGYLRRMRAFSEAELRLKFLQARDAWLAAALSALPRDDPYARVAKTVEACRVHLFDVVTQYRAVFADDDAPPEAAASSSVGVGERDSAREGALFHAWVARKVADFLATLRAALRAGVGPRLDALVGQCFYFGLSFGRVGADFRALLAPLFQEAAREALARALAEAGDAFRDDMDAYTLVATPLKLTGGAGIRPERGVGAQGAATWQQQQQQQQQAGASLQPPASLMDFPPLGYFLNNVLAAFNELRLCCPLALAEDVGACVEATLVGAVDAVLAFHRAEEPAMSAREAELFSRFCAALARELVPHVDRCLQALFPPAELARALGVPLAHLSRLGHLGRLDVEAIVAPLAPLLPPAPPELPPLTPPPLVLAPPHSGPPPLPPASSGSPQAIAVLGSVPPILPGGPPLATEGQPPPRDPSPASDAPSGTTPPPQDAQTAAAAAAEEGEGPPTISRSQAEED